MQSKNKIIVTGGSGFIGSNLIEALNKKNYFNILAVDDLTDGRKFINLTDLKIADYLDKDVFLKKLEMGESFCHSGEKIVAVFHQGACSTTTEWNGKFMMENNYEYSKTLLHYCLGKKIPLIYASSAAVYGQSTVFSELPENERPLNVYGYSKLLFDHYVLRNNFHQAESPVVGFRYFNVYGPRESHKDSMASVAFHLNNQLKSSGTVKLFEGSDGYGNGEQRRDFVYVSDVVDVNLWAFQAEISGIYNVGTGKSQTFNDVAKAVIQVRQKGEIQYIPFPDHLMGCYQSFTEADIGKLRSAGYVGKFKSVEEGVSLYLDKM